MAPLVTKDHTMSLHWSSVSALYFDDPWRTTHPRHSHLAPGSMSGNVAKVICQPFKETFPDVKARKVSPQIGPCPTESIYGSSWFIMHEHVMVQVVTVKKYPPLKNETTIGSVFFDGSPQVVANGHGGK
ncbi:hypothetical protein OIU85_028328 [Salix viminalis]|uniref:Uncharacterized protein n=1 Tax=Salix viminalis TaxID=40686 RepID=A0A9Q0QK63_SALVM|nr:hypothetical protein OIU85_028328 [Salix viminalis]